MNFVTMALSNLLEHHIDIRTYPGPCATNHGSIYVNLYHFVVRFGVAGKVNKVYLQQYYCYIYIYTSGPIAIHSLNPGNSTLPKGL